MPDYYDWIVGEDEDISHVAFIANGGYGTVHKVSINFESQLTRKMTNNTTKEVTLPTETPDEFAYQ
jgi:hypothetical protein